MKIGDEVYIHGYIDEIRKDVVIIRNDGGYFGTDPCEVEVNTDNPQYANGYLDALNEIMKYSYGMLDAEKFGLQHKIQSMIWDFMGDKIADTPQTESKLTANENSVEIPTDTEDFTSKSREKSKLKQTDCGWK